MTSLQQTILFVIDDLELKYFEFNDLVTNFWIIKEFLDRDYEVFIAVKSGLMTEGNVAKTLCWQAYEKDGDIFYKKDEPKKYVIEHFDVVFFRPDPPVDIDYINACSVFDYVDTERTVVINNPIAVKNFNEKFHLNYFPEFAPENIVTASAEEIKAFVREHKKAIIKPLNQCFGGGVYYLDTEERNINTIIKNLTNNGKTMVMVQRYLEGAVHGDKRILIVGEHVFEECIRKLPGKDDFKFSEHSDKYFETTHLTAEEKEMAQKVAKHLNAVELYMVGLDVADGKIMEINVTSPCYFIREINSHNNERFQDVLMEKLINLIELKQGKIPATVC
ncbi:glutathione synthetase [Clostridium sp. CAG:306]|jgi:glutathione synthase|nr:glutathione synthetase [Clostridium sp. CAG:306]